MPPTPTLPQLAHQVQMFAGKVEKDVIDLRGTVGSLKKRLYELEAVEALRERGRPARRRPVFRSQFGEDCAIWEMLGGQTSGFYIEAGAFDGKTFAVTAALDAMGWCGLLVEGIPERYEQCKVNRPDARVVHAALGKTAGGVVRFHVTGDAWGGMLSFVDAKSEHGREAFASGTEIRAVDVPQTTLNELLKDHAGPIDAAVIDVEGGEVEVLKGFDLKRFRPRVLVLEDNVAGGRTPLTNYMQTEDYHLVSTLEVNRMYVHKGEREILERIGFTAG